MVLYEYTYTRRRVADPPASVVSPHEAARVVAAQIGDGANQEHMVVVALNTKYVPIACETVAIGNVAGAPIRLAEVFRLPIVHYATAMVVGHNHPSGDPSPSGPDLMITKDIAAAAQLHDIFLLDHVIVADGGRWASMRALGIIPAGPAKTGGQQ
jgi:DNA repair protein RadC